MQRYKKSIAPARESYALFKIFMIPSRFFHQLFGTFRINPYLCTKKLAFLGRPNKEITHKCRQPLS